MAAVKTENPFTVKRKKTEEKTRGGGKGSLTEDTTSGSLILAILWPNQIRKSKRQRYFGGGGSLKVRVSNLKIKQKRKTMGDYELCSEDFRELAHEEDHAVMPPPLYLSLDLFQIRTMIYLGLGGVFY
jgi:hypothetical protein